ARSKSGKVTTPLANEPLLLAETKVVLAGMVSRTRPPVMPTELSVLTVSVYVNSVPNVTQGKSTRLVIITSGPPGLQIGVVSVKQLLVVFKSLPCVLSSVTKATLVRLVTLDGTL